MTFDAATAVTSASKWRSDPRWRSIQATDLDAFRSLAKLVVFSAHPDDETLGVGGMLAAAAELSIPVHVVVATGDDPRRRGELTAALDELGVSAHIDYLEFPDGALKQHTPQLASAVSNILVQSDGPTWVIAPWPGDRHGDHRVLGEQVEAAGRSADTKVFFYPVWLWQWGTPDQCPWERMREVSLSRAVQDRKQAALARFGSQIQSFANPDGVLTGEFLENFIGGREVLIVPDPESSHRATNSLEDHFEQLHAESSDPWAVRDRWYERRKRAVTMASLPHERYVRALEIGCSVGELSAELVERCEYLVAVDGSPSAVTTARNRLRESPTATVQHMQVPHEWPEGEFDLIVVSEVAYYLSPDAWRATIQRCRDCLTRGGTILLCHWLGVADDFAQTGARAHQVFRDESTLRALVVHREHHFILELFADKKGPQNE
ncbi:MAG: PIG-L family deacetylase [Lacisediminihabitans sp.]